MDHAGVVRARFHAWAWMALQQTDGEARCSDGARSGESDDTAADDRAVGTDPAKEPAIYHTQNMTRVPLLDLQAQYAPIREAVIAAIERVCDSQRFIGGEEVEAFERELAGMLGVEHVIGVSSGTDALVAALMAFDVGPGDEVITSAYSFFATAGCIARLGAKPVFVDIDAITFNIDSTAVEAA